MLHCALLWNLRPTYGTPLPRFLTFARWLLTGFLAVCATRTLCPRLGSKDDDLAGIEAKRDLSAFLDGCPGGQSCQQLNLRRMDRCRRHALEASLIDHVRHDGGDGRSDMDVLRADGDTGLAARHQPRRIEDAVRRRDAALGIDLPWND